MDQSVIVRHIAKAIVAFNDSLLSHDSAAPMGLLVQVRF